MNTSLQTFDEAASRVILGVLAVIVLLLAALAYGIWDAARIARRNKEAADAAAKRPEKEGTVWPPPPKR